MADATRAIVTSAATGGPAAGGGTVRRVRHNVAFSVEAGGSGKPRLQYNTGGTYAMDLKFSPLN